MCEFQETLFSKLPSTILLFCLFVSRCVPLYVSLCLCVSLCVCLWWWTVADCCILAFSKNWYFASTFAYDIAEIQISLRLCSVSWYSLLILTPMRQFTSTTPPVSRASSMKLATRGKYWPMLACGLSGTLKPKNLIPKACQNLFHCS